MRQIYQSLSGVGGALSAVSSANAARTCSADRRRRRSGVAGRRDIGAAARAAAATAARSRDDSQTCQRTRPRSIASGASAGPRTVDAGPGGAGGLGGGRRGGAGLGAPSRASMRSAIMRENGG